MSEAIRINKYMPIAILYFFFNGFLLPLGLLYTTLLTPFLLVWLYRYPSFRYLKMFFVFTIPFIVIHVINGVHIGYYFRSYFLLFTVFVFALSFFQFLKVCKTLGIIYRNLIAINLFLLPLALVALFIPGLRETFWQGGNLSYNIQGIDRLKLFTYEPSYYSTLLVPIALYYYLKALMNKLPDTVTMLIIVTFPLLLSFSFGVILGLILALLITLLTNLGSFFKKQMVAAYILTGSIILVIGLAAIILFFPDNIFFHRIINVFEGKDSSFKGRTYDAMYLSWNVAEMKSIFFGAGLGQTKVLGLDLWRDYYAYKFSANQIAISNVMGDTIAVFGLAGVFIRLGLQVYLFFKTKVFTNFYRLALFIFIFIYQFTGSFLYNIAEYVIWILAFSNVFEEFNKKKIPA